jgi:hypothetical protein
LIFDNVDTEAAAQAVKDLLGRLQPAGQVLVTSRLSNWPGAVPTLALDVLGEDYAAAFLLERTADRRLPCRTIRRCPTSWRWSSGSWLSPWSKPAPTSPSTG